MPHACRTRRRPSLTSPRGRLRAARRVAAGLDPGALAQAEAASPAEIEALLAQPRFQRMVASCRALAALPEAERLERLLVLAWQVLEQALIELDVGAALFVAEECRRGRHPARTLVAAVLAQQRVAATTPARTARPRAGAPRARRPADPLQARSRRAAARLSTELVEEHGLHQADEAGASAPARTAARPLVLTAHRNRLLAGVAAAPQPTPGRQEAPARLLRAWAQGP